METIIHVFQAGGFVMIPLIIFLVISWVIGIERIMLFRRFKREMNRFKKAVATAPKSDAWVTLPLTLERECPEVGPVFGSVMRSARNYESLENRLYDLVGYIDGRLKRGLGWLNMIVTMAPLLGLLGTVLGMIRAFAVVGGNIGASTIISGGVSEALIATATGLIVAIIALGFHSYCANKVNDFVAELEHDCGNLLDLYNDGESV